MVNLLLENKSPLNATDISGLTALHHGECPVSRLCTSLGSRSSLITQETLMDEFAGLMTNDELIGPYTAISEGHGDTALVLLRAGAETDKRDADGSLAIKLSPDKKVGEWAASEQGGASFPKGMNLLTADAATAGPVIHTADMRKGRHRAGRR